MKLPIQPSAQTRLLLVFSALKERGACPVLVGGLVPPLLLERLDPEGHNRASDPRRTVDCDIGVPLALDVPGRLDELYASLRDLGLVRDNRVNQFCWRHRDDHLCLDMVPVPSGVERKDPAALAFAKQLAIEDAETFYRGTEAAFVDFEEIVIDGVPLRIAGLLPLLAMKLQAWTDRRYERKRDAQDVGWLLRHLDCDAAVKALLRRRSMHPDLFAEVVDRLQRGFSDEEDEGIMDCFPTYDEAVHGRHAGAIVSAVLALLRAIARSA